MRPFSIITIINIPILPTASSVPMSLMTHSSNYLTKYSVFMDYDTVKAFLGSHQSLFTVP